jgi:hypothetical protein
MTDDGRQMKGAARAAAHAEVLRTTRELQEVMGQIPVRSARSLKQSLKEIEAESDTLRLHDLAEQYGLAFRQVGGTYRFDGYTAHGLPQALGYAEGFDRARHHTPPTDEDIATWIPGADYGNPAETPRLHDLARKHGLLFRRFGSTYKFLDFNAHGLRQALGYVEGFDRAMASGEG